MYFWIRLIRAAGTCSVAFSAKRRVRYSSLCAILVDGLHPHELGDAMGDVNDVIAVLQIEE